MVLADEYLDLIGQCGAISLSSQIYSPGRSPASIKRRRPVPDDSTARARRTSRPGAALEVVVGDVMQDTVRCHIIRAGQFLRDDVIERGGGTRKYRNH